ncbi:uncharacterized mitochondrial protein AtMg00810-like [Helianthus annuus]|uniref:uncharacterized mitochondrial protein AtMg00810-like n=1 Tax=Helianthus annuus TaxID=4232 RepID=UPI000B8F5447|nr:uncharacterized mitochondrial protein AtMg00810-like [Helianthus annuus]
MKDLGPLSFFLGISVKRHKGTMFLSQQVYANEIIERAGMQSCNPVATPVDTHTKLSSNAGEGFENPTLYRSLAGALQYLTFTHPDISYVVQQVCVYMHDPKIDHWLALKISFAISKGQHRMVLHLVSLRTHLFLLIRMRIGWDARILDAQLVGIVFIMVTI